jgi:DNA repair protein RadD
VIHLRPYQHDAIAALFSYWQAEGGNGLIVLPTGAGKSLVIADLMRRLIENWPQMRIICVTHTRELIVQNFQELLRLWPSAPAGIYSAGVGRRDTHAKILFCGVQSVFKRTAQIGRADLILVDEAHLIPRNAATMYGKFFNGMRAHNLDMRIAGLTATPYRLDSGRLDEGADRMFDAIVYEANVLDLISDGYLSPLISKASVTASLDLTGLGTRAGEFITEQAEARAMAAGVIEAAVDEMIALAGERRAWLAFCVTVAHAKAVAEALNAKGIPAAAVDGEMPKGERDSVIRRFREGQLRALTSVNVLSIGFNVPHVDLIALMRPTKSSGLYIQQVGRGFRMAPGKGDCLILDFAKVVRMHGPVDAVVPNGSARGAGKGDKAEASSVRAKECPTCATYAALNARTCAACGYEWPTPKLEIKHDAQADDSAGILSTERVRPQLVPVVSWSFARHEKPGSPDSVRVTYIAGLEQVREWLPFEHDGYARQKACQWWALHGGRTPFPRTVDEAMARAGELAMPAGINLRPNGKFLEITGRHFARNKEEAA